MRQLAAFIISFIVWLLLVGPYSFARGWDVQALVAGLVVAAIIALFFGGRIYERAGGRAIDPRRWFWLLCYMPFFLYHVIRANLQVAYLVLHPDLPIRPGIVCIKSSLRSTSALAALANSITLTPGTLSIDAREDGTIYVHWLVVTEEDDEKAAREIAGRFEWFIKRIFD
ncbi:MAG TPA: Na+/H+ antiporter subunit E [Planctomycetes bacterium]|nr:Na+/H+ antiporter subunit E [Planctomycetota bacterium]